MDCLIIEDDKKIIMFCNVEDMEEIGLEIKENWKIISSYEKLWPIDKDGKRLVKNACYWDDKNKEVKAKTTEMLQVDVTKTEIIDIKSTCELLNKVLFDCETFDDLKTKISGMII